MNEIMNAKYRMYRRQRGVFYVFDRQTGQRESLQTADENEARRLLHARNEAHQQPLINRQIARAYLAVGDPQITRRTWADVTAEIIKLKTGVTQTRWQVASKDHAFQALRDLPVFATQAEHFLRALERGGVSTNVYLRRIHNFALDMGWLPGPVLAPKHWPTLQFQPKRGLTWEEHTQILAAEKNPERRLFYDLLWETGTSQSDAAALHAESIDWPNRLLRYCRMKTGTPACLAIGPRLEGVLRALSAQGPLFPTLGATTVNARSAEFWRRCKLLGIKGVSLHSYRYSWAERAKTAGYPERFAQEALGHNSKAVHRAYARNAHVTMPSLEEYQNQRAVKQVIPLPLKREPTPLPHLQGDRSTGETPTETRASELPAPASARPWRNAG